MLGKLLCKLGFHDYRVHIYHRGKEVRVERPDELPLVKFETERKYKIRCFRCGKKGKQVKFGKPRVLVIGWKED